MGKVLLIGGTGAIGTYLGKELVASGHTVLVTSRKPHESSSLRYLVGNGHDVDFVDRVLRDERPDAVVDFMIYSSEEFKARYEILLTHTAHYLFLSSYRVFAGSSAITERSPRLLDVSTDRGYLATDEYALAKARCENLLRQSAFSNWTILRPCITYSTRRFQFGCLEADTICYRASHGLPVVMPTEMLDRKTTLSWAGDVAKMISRLVLYQRALGDDFNVATSEHHTWREVADLYAEIIGMKVQKVSVDDYCQICGEYQVKYDRMFDRVIDNRKILEVTGMRQDDLEPLAVGLRRELRAFMENPVYVSKNIAQNARMDALCNGASGMDLSELAVREKLTYCCNRYAMIGKIVHSLKSLCA